MWLHAVYTVSFLKFNWDIFLCWIQVSLAGIGLMLQSQWHLFFFFFYYHKGEMLNAQEHCVHLTLCIVSPWDLSLSLVHRIQVHGYFVRLARASWCWWGKGCGIWTDGGIGGMVCVVGMRGRQRGAGQSVCSCSIHGLEARAWTQRRRDDGEKGSRSQKRGRKVERHWERDAAGVTKAGRVRKARRRWRERGKKKMWLDQC